MGERGHKTRHEGENDKVARGWIEQCSYPLL